jgi:hypothetical protein
LASCKPVAFSPIAKRRFYAEEESQAVNVSLPGAGSSDQFTGRVRQTPRRNNMLGGRCVFGTSADEHIHTAFTP